VSPRRVAVLGSTGSIGVQALEIIDAHPRLRLHSILCNSSHDLILEQAERYAPDICAAVTELPQGRGALICGTDALPAAIHGSDIVLNAIVGSAGLEASLLCQEEDIPLALANKESLVVGGELLKRHLDSGKIIPVDSEHSTIFRCIQSEYGRIRKIVITASGGSTLRMPIDRLEKAAPHEILAHPTWDMGSRITVDSATMVNKAFEVIEARWLFGDVPVEAVIHPQSIVHSLVCLSDGSWKALLGEPDMRIPIQYALLWPQGELHRISSDEPVSWRSLEFLELDSARYPAFDVVVRAGMSGRTYPAAANAADEVAVGLFLKGEIPFGSIARLIEAVVDEHQPREIGSLKDVLISDSEARAAAMRISSGLL